MKLETKFSFSVENITTHQQFIGQENSFYVTYSYLPDLVSGDFNPHGYDVNSQTYPFYQNIKDELIEFVMKYKDKTVFYEILGQDLAKHLLQIFPQLKSVELIIKIFAYGGVKDNRNAHISLLRD